MLGIGINEIIEGISNKLKCPFPDIEIVLETVMQESATEFFQVLCDINEQNNSTAYYIETSFIITIYYYQKEVDNHRKNIVMDNLRKLFIDQLKVIDSDTLEKRYLEIENLNISNSGSNMSTLTFNIYSWDQSENPDIAKIDIDDCIVDEEEYEIATVLKHEIDIDC